LLIFAAIAAAFFISFIACRRRLIFADDSRCLSFSRLFIVFFVYYFDYMKECAVMRCGGAQADAQAIRRRYVAVVHMHAVVDAERRLPRSLMPWYADCPLSSAPYGSHAAVLPVVWLPPCR